MTLELQNIVYALFICILSVITAWFVGRAYANGKFFETRRHMERHNAEAYQEDEE